MTSHLPVLRPVEDAPAAIALANHATQARLVAVPGAYDVVGALDELVHRLPQLVAHLARSVDRAPRDGLFDDRRRDPEEALHDAHHALRAVGSGLDVVGVHLAVAHNALGHLGRQITED